MKLDILLLDSKSQNPNHYIVKSVKSALKRHDSVKEVVEVNYGNAVDIATKRSFDILIVMDGEELVLPIIYKLKALCNRTVIWFTEDPYEIKTNKENGKLFDFVFTNDSTSVPEYSNGFHLPFAASREFNDYNVIQDDDDYLYDVLFVGTAWPNRVKLIRQILEKLPDRKLKVALPYNQFIQKPNLSIPESDWNYTVSPSEFSRLAHYSRIVLFIHRDFTNDGGTSLSETPGPRFFEVAFSGGYQLVSDRISECNRYLNLGKHFDTYSTADDCVEKIEKYLKDPDLRIKMATQAKQHIEINHLYEDRVETILRHVEGKIQDGKTDSIYVQKKKRILLVSHSDLTRSVFGGIEIVQNIDVEKLQDEFEFFYYLRKQDPQQANVSLGVQIMDAELNVLEERDFSPIVDDSVLTCAEREEYFFYTLARHGIDLVHFHHLMGHVPSLISIAKSLGTPVVLTAHDYFFLCDSFNLLNSRGRFCQIESLAIESCGLCIQRRKNLDIDSILKRRNFLFNMLSLVDSFICHSNDVKERFLAVVDNLNPNKISCLPCPCPETQVFNLNDVSKSDDQLEVAVLGNFTKQKGADLMLEIFDQLRYKNVTFHVYGRVDSEYLEILSVLKLKKVVFYGKYSPGESLEQLQKCHLSLHLSCWPETFCITLSEVWNLGVIPIVSDLGALNERVQNGINGFITRHDEAGDVVSIINYLNRNRDRLNKVRKNIIQNNYEYTSVHVEEMRKIYIDFLKDKPVSKPLTSPLNSKPTVNINTLGFYVESPHWQVPYRHPGGISDIYGEVSMMKRLKALIRKFQTKNEEEGLAVACKMGAKKLKKIVKKRMPF